MTPTSLAARTAAALAAACLLAAATTGASAAPAERPVGGRDYKIYVADVYGTDLGACRGRLKDGAYRVRGLVDARAAERDDTRGGLVVWRNSSETGRRWDSGAVAAASYATGSVLVPRGDAYTVAGYAGIDGAGDSFRTRAAAIPVC